MTEQEVMLCLLLPSAPHPLNISALGFEVKKRFMRVLSAALPPHSEASGIDHAAFEHIGSCRELLQGLGVCEDRQTKVPYK